MSNRNINVNRGTDTKDNTVYRDYIETIDTWSTAKAIGLVLGVITSIWLVIYFLARIGCALDKSYDCTSAVYVFWTYPLLLTLAMLIALVAAIPYIKQMIENSAYLHMRGARVHREDLRKSPDRIFGVLDKSATSEATAGMDTYSPSLSNSNKNEGIKVDDDDFDVNVITWDEIFKRGR